MLSLRDVLRLGAEKRQATSVQAAMKPLSEAVVVRPQTPLRDALGARAREWTPRGLPHAEHRHAAPARARSARGVNPERSFSS